MDLVKNERYKIKKSELRFGTFIGEMSLGEFSILDGGPDHSKDPDYAVRVLVFKHMNPEKILDFGYTDNGYCYVVKDKINEYEFIQQ